MKQCEASHLSFRSFVKKSDKGNTIWKHVCMHKSIHGTDTRTCFHSSSGHIIAASYIDLQFSLFQKGLTVHQVLCSAICVSLEMTSSVTFKGKKETCLLI